MSEFFLNIVNMSISASWIVLAVLLLRLLLKKAPKWITVLLWGIVAVRLICPFTVESVMSLIPSAETISPEIMMDNTPEINSGIPILNNTINPVISESFAPDPATSANPLQILIPLLSVAWIVGVAGMLLYTVISYFRVKRKVGTAVLLRDNIFQSESVVSPFVLGIIKPRIYLPFKIAGQDMEHVIAHEQAHIRRKDHWWKPFGFLLLTLHWFNPLMWLGYVLLCRDIELACDEKVVKELDTEQRADYSQALLTCSVNRRMIAACPLAFGEVGVKSRVKSVLNYKKPAFWIIVLAIIASIVVAICFLTNPRTSLDAELAVFIDGQIMEHHQSDESEGHFAAIDYEVLDVDKSLSETTVYMWVLYQEYSNDNGEIKLEAGAHIPTVVTAKRTGSHRHYELVEYWEPRDGSYYTDDIKEKFPWYLHNKALDSQRTIDKQQSNCLKAAENYFSSSSNVGGADGPVNVITSVDMEQLKAKFPNYFGLSTTKGLEVYIWQMAEGSYSCGLLSGKNLGYTQEELWNLHTSSASMDEMRAIVANYMANGEVTKSDIVIHAIGMPHSSYAYTIDDEYRQKLNELFWSKIPIVENSNWTLIIDEATFDIDGDGKSEQCTIGYGPTSGLHTFKLSVWEIGSTDNRFEYINVFISDPGDLSFVETDEGMKLRLMPQGETQSIDYSFSVKEGNIVLSADGESLGYWGEQGVGTIFAAHNSSELYETTSIDEIEAKYDNEEFVITKMHYKGTDGMWACEGYSYKYRLEITGRLSNASKNSTYIVLSNTKDITFEQTWRASGLSSLTTDYFDPSVAVIVGNKLFS